MMIQAGIPAHHKETAARLYWQAFRHKLTRAMGPEPKALAFISRVMRLDHGICALSDDGALLGVIGFKTPKGALVGGTFSDLCAIYGRFGAFWRAAVLSLLERDIENERFLLDGIFVDADARGKGVGKSLLAALYQEASRRGYAEVRLDVINTNPRARALYEREGFVPIKTDHLGPLKLLFGFASSTTMVRPLA